MTATAAAQYLANGQKPGIDRYSMTSSALASSVDGISDAESLCRRL
jgi:hypothetical protein